MNRYPENHSSSFPQRQQRHRLDYSEDPCQECSCNVPVILKLLEMCFGIVVCFLTGLYCRYGICTINWISYNQMFLHIYVIAVAIMAVIMSFGFLMLHTCCTRVFELWKPFEIVIAGISSILYFISGVIEVVYAAEFNYNYFSEQWAAAAAFAFLLSIIHASDAVYIYMFFQKNDNNTTQTEQQLRRVEPYVSGSSIPN